MKIYHQPVELIVTAPPANAKSKSPFNLKKQLADAGIPVESISKKTAQLPAGKKTGAKALAVPLQEKLYVKTKIRDSEMNPWDVAHTASKAMNASFIEPDLLQEFAVDRNIDAA